MHANETALWLALAGLPFVISLYFVSRNERKGLGWLLAGAAAIRTVMIALDPYLHSWDERYHALVAKI